ncbi:uncharacterized protein LOC100568692 [Acyrthosiphon pisum]|uniref:RING-type domain-containing protein n=1 Tax=Acyrthosiphon pisum TaxID=7029 RepID=A0A8R2B2H4_ACYPI|nr:uncharacterized protein LOC100568692 [Acyrthosiphon pisum]|eukprot:XP_008179552.2 PREDICTED: uncharacterized protein LOC100568692 [Acyrthosiphon pisum]
MSHTENSNTKYHVNNDMESNSSKSVQSTQEKKNSHSATNQYALDVTEETTYSTRSCTQSNDTRYSAQRNDNIPNIHGFDFGESSSQSNNIDSRSYMSQYVHRTLSGLTAESWAQYKTRYPTSNHFRKTHPNLIEYTQVCPRWYRIVSIDVNAAESNESFSSSQPRKVQRTTNGRRNTAGITNSQSDVEWYRRVNRDVIESQKSALSSRSERLERRSESQQPIPPSSSFQAQSNGSRPESSVNNIHRSDSLTEPIAPNTQSNENVRYQSDNVIPPALHCQLQNLNSNQSPSVSTFSNPERGAAQDMTFVPSSDVTNNSNRAQVLIDLDDIATNTEDQPNSFYEVNRNLVTHAIEIIPTHPPTNSTVINEPESLEVVIRSRNNADYKFVISNPAIIRMHKVLQRCILSSDNTSSSVNNSILYQQVNHYMRVLRSTILSTDSNATSISSLMSASVPRSLTIDQSSYPLLENTSEMPPVIIIDRIQNGCVIKELTNCAICLEDDNGNVLLEPCNHYNMCGTCMERLTTWICPICRSHITNIIVYV